MKSLLAISLLWLSLPFSVSLASDAVSPEEVYNSYMTADTVQIEEVIPTAEELYSDWLDSAQGVLPDQAPEEMQGISWDQMVLIGEKLIEIIKAGAPVVNIKRDSVSVLPAGARDWQQMAGWKAPVTKVFAVQLKNLWGNVVVSFRLKLSAMHGGTYNSRGKYLANVVLVPSQVYVAWGWNLDVWSENRDPVNTGTVKNPVAGLGVDLRFKVKSMLNELQGAQDYWITGAGEMSVVQ